MTQLVFCVVIRIQLKICLTLLGILLHFLVVDMSKFEVIHIGRLKGSAVKIFNKEGLIWKDSTFKTHGINFSLNVNALI